MTRSIPRRLLTAVVLASAATTAIPAAASADNPPLPTPCLTTNLITNNPLACPTPGQPPSGGGSGSNGSNGSSGSNGGSSHSRHTTTSKTHRKAHRTTKHRTTKHRSHTRATRRRHG